jgi:hypothetical protein
VQSGFVGLCGNCIGQHVIIFFLGATFEKPLNATAAQNATAKWQEEPAPRPFFIPEFSYITPIG